MKQVHNVRIRAIEQSPDEAKAILDEFLTAAAIERKDVQITVTDDEGAVLGEAWIERQQPVRTLLAHLKEKLSEPQKKDIANNPSHYLDTGTHVYLRLSKDAFREGDYRVIKSGNCIHIRINIAAFPATKENAMQILSEIFTAT